MTKVWKFGMAIVLVCALALAGMAIRTQTSAGKNEVKNPDQFRAVWVSTVYRLDYPSKATTDPAVLKADADKILQTCADMGRQTALIPWPTGWRRPMRWGWSFTPGSTPSG